MPREPYPHEDLVQYDEEIQGRMFAAEVVRHLSCWAVGGLHNGAKGRIGEFLAMARLTAHGLDPFVSHVDVAGVDMAVFVAKEGQEPLALRLQVKSAAELRAGFRLPRDRALWRRADYYLLVAHDFAYNERLWSIPAGELPHLVAETSTKESIKDLIWKPKEHELKRFEGFTRELKGPHHRDFHATRVGRIGESLATAWLIGKGCSVYPAGTDYEGVDLIAVQDRQCRYIQVKYSTKGVQFRNVKAEHAGAPKEQLDYLFVRGEPRLYVRIPANAFTSAGNLYLTREMIGEYAVEPSQSLDLIRA